MCVGPELALAASLAASAGGTYLQTQEANKNAQRQQNAKDQAFAANMTRGRAFADEAGAQQARNTAQQGRENFDIQRQAEADKVVDLFNADRVQPDYNVGAAPSSLPKNVILARQSASEDAAAKTDRDVNNNAQLQGYGGAQFNQSLDQNEFARLFGNIQDKAGVNTRMLPLEMNAAANNAKQSSSIFPTLLKTAGTAGSMFAGAGGSFTGTAPGSFSSMAPGQFGPPVPLKANGLFMNNQPVNLFGYQLAGRYS